MQTTKTHFQAGVFVLAALFTLAIGILLIGQEKHIFSSQDEFNTSFREVSGLSEGAPVRLGGITVGRVSEISFGSDALDPTVYVQFLVNTEFINRIRVNSVASIRTQGLLGDKYLSISSGKELKSSQPAAKPGSYIRGEDEAALYEVVNKAEQIVDHTIKIARSVDEVLQEFKEDTVKNISDSARGIASITRQVENGKGLMHRLFYSKQDADNIINGLSEITQNVNNVVKEIKQGQGLLHTLIYDPKGEHIVSSIDLAATELAESASNITKLVKEIHKGDGLMHHLIYGDYVDISQKVNQTVDNLNATAAALKKAADALASGQGTIGALLVDSQVYDNLVEVTDGAKRSYLLRSAIRSSLEKE